MKTGRDLAGLATELQRQLDSKKDLVAPTSQLVLHKNQESQIFELGVNGFGNFALTPHTHRQIAERLKIPQKYYDRMMTEAPELLEHNVDHWFHAVDERRMIRTLDGRARAFLSDRYRQLDNVDMAEAVFPILQNDQLNTRIESAELTDTHFYIKAISPRITFEVKKGDIVQAGIVVSNSEIGLGSVKVEPMIYRLACLNGMISADASMRKYHVGRAGADIDLDTAAEFFRDETREADDRAFWMKVQDVVRAAFDQISFEKIVAKMSEALGMPITKDPVEVVEIVQKRFVLSNDERGSVLSHLIKGGDLSKYGLLNAVTRASQDVADYDRATELERTGGLILELPPKDWEQIAA